MTTRDDVLKERNGEFYDEEPTVTRSEMEAALTDEVLDDIAKALGVYRRRRDKSKGATAILNAVFGETT